MLRSSSLRTRLIGAFAVLVLVFVAMAANRVADSESIGATSAAARDAVVDDLRAANRADAAAVRRSSALQAALLAPDIDGRAAALTAIGSHDADVRAALDDLADAHPAIVGARDRFATTYAELDTAVREVAGMAELGQLTAARVLADDAVVPLVAELADAAREMVAGAEQATVEVEEAAAAASAGSVTRTYLAVVLVVLFAAGWAWFVARSIGRRLGTAIGALEHQASGLQTVSRQLDHGAGTLGADAAGVASSGEQVASGVQTVATSVEELHATAREIAASAADAARTASEAVAAGESAASTVGELTASSAQVGEIVSVIASLAEQTNLLALNASVEAARAGDAGRGFAVVAGEVKALASRTAEATEQIGTQLERIRTDSDAAGREIDAIAAIIARIADGQATIAAAVEEQTATTDEVARTVAEAADASGQIAGRIATVADATEGTRRGAAAALAASDQLGAVAHDLRVLVDGARAAGGVTAPAASAVATSASGGLPAAVTGTSRPGDGSSLRSDRAATHV